MLQFVGANPIGNFVRMAQNGVCVSQWRQTTYAATSIDAWHTRARAHVRGGDRTIFHSICLFNLCSNKKANDGKIWFSGCFISCFCSFGWVYFHCFFPLRSALDDSKNATWIFNICSRVCVCVKRRDGLAFASRICFVWIMMQFWGEC